MIPMDLPYVMEHFRAVKPNGFEAVPETLQQLKELKKRFMEEHFVPIEKAFMINALKAADGNITHAAEKVGMKRPNFHALMKKYKILADG